MHQRLKKECVYFKSQKGTENNLVVCKYEIGFMRMNE